MVAIRKGGQEIQVISAWAFLTVSGTTVYGVQCTVLKKIEKKSEYLSEKGFFEVG